MIATTLANLLAAASTGRLPEYLTQPDVLLRLRTDRTWIESIAGGAIEVYGVNRRPGHRDDERVGVAGQVDLQRQILESHLVPPLADGCYRNFQTRCMGLAKACAVALGGTGMTPALYRQLLAALTDDRFHPLVPCAQSYSSGDVIPAAHWARGLLDWNGYAQRIGAAPGEAMALINGHFVHVGLAAAGFPVLRQCGARLAQACAAVAVVSKAPSGTFARAQTGFPDAAQPLLECVMAQVGAGGSLAPRPTQAAVSVRAIPEVLAGYASATTWLAAMVERALRTASGNPLFDAGRQQVYSQGSFLAPAVALAQSAMIEVMLLAAWTLVAQVEFLLSGRVDGVAVDAATPHDPLGLIQVPKAMQATLEDLRLRFGRRGFASGASTSHGIEDLWTHGESLSRAVDALAAAVTALAVRTQAVCELLVGDDQGDGETSAAEQAAPIAPSRTLRRLEAAERRLRDAPLVAGFMAWAVGPQGHAAGPSE